MKNINTEIIKVNSKNPENKIIRKAAYLIRKGDIVAFPTETVYGLGANAFDARAVKKIFHAKGRPSDNPLIVHISDMRMANDLVEEIPKRAIPLMEKFWPGPLTLVMKKKKNVPDAVTAGGNTVGIRMPNHKIALALIAQSRTPLAAPSANTSTRPSATEAKHVREDMEGKIPLILDGGRTQIGVESTVLDLSGHIPALLRKGKITKKDIEKIIGPVADRTQKTRGRVKSPGQKYMHYAPKAELVLVRGGVRSMRNAVREFRKKDPYVVTFSERKNMYPFAKKVFVLGKGKDEISAAKKFFSVVRRCDASGADVILVEAPSRRGVGDALYDRISRGAKRIV